MRSPPPRAFLDARFRTVRRAPVCRFSNVGRPSGTDQRYGTSPDPKGGAERRDQTPPAFVDQFPRLMPRLGSSGAHLGSRGAPHVDRVPMRWGSGRWEVDAAPRLDGVDDQE